MIKECTITIFHDIKNFELFYNDYNNNKNIAKYDMSFKKYQEYFVKTLFKQNEINNFNDTVINFKQSFKKEFILTQKEVMILNII